MGGGEAEIIFKKSEKIFHRKKIDFLKEINNFSN